MTAKSRRIAALRQMLDDRRREIQNQLHSGIRDRRTDRAKDVLDYLEHSDADIQSHIHSALIEMRAGTLARIDQALVRLVEGRYGSCVECDREISAGRLHALPFAVRCRGCEDRREQEQGRTRRLGGGMTSLSLFPDALSS